MRDNSTTTNWIVRLYNHRGFEMENFTILDRTESSAQKEASAEIDKRTGVIDWTMEELEKLPVGVIFDSPRGIYIGLAVQELALQYGWDETQFVRSTEDEFYHEATDEATEYLNKFVEDGHGAGFIEGMWGVFPDEDWQNL
jgi:hypothetical protein